MMSFLSFPRFEPCKQIFVPPFVLNVLGDIAVISGLLSGVMLSFISLKLLVRVWKLEFTFRKFDADGFSLWSLLRSLKDLELRLERSLGNALPNVSVGRGCSLATFLPSNGDLLSVSFILPNVPVLGESCGYKVEDFGTSFDTQAWYSSEPCGDWHFFCGWKENVLTASFNKFSPSHLSK